MPCYCEICGRKISDEKLCRTVVLDNAILRVCPQCYNRLVKQGKIKTVPTATTKPKPRKTVSNKWVRTRISRRLLEESYDIVEDYAERIRRARQKLGWSQAVLAQKVREKENVIKRIEAGRLKPSIELARRLEKILGITLLEPIIDEYIETYSSKSEDYFTIGDFIKIKKNKK